MMLTGGSPTMHGALVNELTHFAHEKNNFYFSLLKLKGAIFSYQLTILLICFLLVPKFSNSVPVLGVPTPQGAVTDQRMMIDIIKLRLNYESIKQSIAYHSDYPY